ncbi:MAG TPA: M23 family metallopeptidase [Planctomycetes bacterium]|nr:M23 family metallopeptidase [Fuerstiella sp.]HIK96423.1 M23 family metallopeptidase [Planctomycetota bacterium]
MAYQDWTIVNYSDVDFSDGRADFLGGDYQYNRHDALDITLADFQQMDAGVEVYAVTAGTIVQVRDGEFDRNNPDQVNPSSNANFVSIDHGGGLITNYFHFRRDTIAVSVGDSVAEGQLLGLVGSSGNSSDAHLHFGVRYVGANLETYYAPDAWWFDPLPYSGTQPGVLSSLVKDYAPTRRDMREGPSVPQVYDQSSGPSLRFSIWGVHGLTAGKPAQIRWFRPDGTVFRTYNWTTAVDRYSWRYWNASLGSVPDIGVWTVTFEVEGEELTRASFEVTASGTPEIRINDSDGVLIGDSRSTPIDVGTVAQGGSNPSQTFTVTNHGSSTLDLGAAIILPRGFLLVDGLSATLAPGGAILLPSHSIRQSQATLLDKSELPITTLTKATIIFPSKGV